MGGIEALPFGLLVFVTGSLLAANAWAVVDVRMATSSAAREAARRYVEAPDGEVAVVEAREAAADVLIAHGRRPARAVIAIEHAGATAFARCTRVVVDVAYPVPALTLPWIGGYGDAFEARARHSEIVDPFRAGVPGEGPC